MGCGYHRDDEMRMSGDAMRGDEVASPSIYPECRIDVILWLCCADVVSAGAVLPGFGLDVSVSEDVV